MNFTERLQNVISNFSIEKAEELYDEIEATGYKGKDNYGGLSSLEMELHSRLLQLISNHYKQEYVKFTCSPEFQRIIEEIKAVVFQVNNLRPIVQTHHRTLISNHASYAKNISDADEKLASAVSDLSNALNYI